MEFTNQLLKSQGEHAQFTHRTSPSTVLKPTKGTRETHENLKQKTRHTITAQLTHFTQATMSFS
jgi:hypothetical protein